MAETVVSIRFDSIRTTNRFNLFQSNVYFLAKRINLLLLIASSLALFRFIRSSRMHKCCASTQVCRLFIYLIGSQQHSRFVVVVDAAVVIEIKDVTTRGHKRIGSICRKSNQ